MLNHRILIFAASLAVRLGCICCLLILAGCQSESVDETPSPQKPSKPTAETPKKLALREISQDALELDKVLSDAVPVEPGKLEIAGPANWGWAPRSSSYVARFYLDKTRRTRLPRIWITAETPSQPAIETVTRDNVMEYATQLARQLKSESNHALLEPVRPMVIGGRPCARYVRQTRFTFNDGNNKRSLEVERQILQTMVAGRQFTIELHVLPGDLKQFRDVAYAVLAGIHFLEDAPTETPEETATGEEPTTDTP